MPTRAQTKNPAGSFEWIGVGTIDDGKVFYSEYSFSGCLIKSGDDVIVNGDGDEYFVGHVEKLYELEGARDPNRAIIRRYFTSEELKKCAAKRNFDIAESSRELFLPCQDVKLSTADIDAETISRKCTVLKLKPQDLPPNNLTCGTHQDLFYMRFKFDGHYNLHAVHKRIACDSVSKRKRVTSINVSNTKTPTVTPRGSATRKQKPVNENRMNNAARTPKERKTPARRKIVDDSSGKTKTEPLTKVNNKLPKSKCSVPLDPLVFNGDVVTPSRAKRRASRSIPDESSVTPKRSKGCGQGTKTAKEPVTSPRQRFGTAEVLEQVLEDEDEDKDVSDDYGDDDDDDDDSVFQPNEADVSSDDDEEDVFETVANSHTRGQVRHTPARTLRSAKKKPSFTSIQDTPRGNRNIWFRSSGSGLTLLSPGAGPI